MTSRPDRPAVDLSRKYVARRPGQRRRGRAKQHVELGEQRRRCLPDLRRNRQGVKQVGRRSLAAYLRHRPDFGAHLLLPAC